MRRCSVHNVWTLVSELVRILEGSEEKLIMTLEQVKLEENMAAECLVEALDLENIWFEMEWEKTPEKWREPWAAPPIRKWLKLKLRKL